MKNNKEFRNLDGVIVILICLGIVTLSQNSYAEGLLPDNNLKQVNSISGLSFDIIEVQKSNNEFRILIASDSPAEFQFKVTFNSQQGQQAILDTNLVKPFETKWLRISGPSTYSNIASIELVPYNIQEKQIVLYTLSKKVYLITGQEKPISEVKEEIDSTIGKIEIPENQQLLISSSSNKTYFYAGKILFKSIDQDNNLRYYHYDVRKNIVAITNEASNAVVSLGYSPFGEVWKETALNPVEAKNTYKFQGKEFDNKTSLYAFDFRYYSPKIARFLQPDPIRKAGESPYTYSSNNPFYLSDPTGLQSNDDIFAWQSQGHIGSGPTGFADVLRSQRREEGVRRNLERSAQIVFDEAIAKGADLEEAKQEAALFFAKNWILHKIRLNSLSIQADSLNNIQIALKTGDKNVRLHFSYQEGRLSTLETDPGGVSGPFTSLDTDSGIMTIVTRTTDPVEISQVTKYRVLGLGQSWEISNLGIIGFRMMLQSSDSQVHKPAQRVSEETVVSAPDGASESGIEESFNEPKDFSGKRTTALNSIYFSKQFENGLGINAQAGGYVPSFLNYGGFGIQYHRGWLSGGAALNVQEGLPPSYSAGFTVGSEF